MSRRSVAIGTLSGAKIFAERKVPRTKMQQTPEPIEVRNFPDLGIKLKIYAPGDLLFLRPKLQAKLTKSVHMDANQLRDYTKIREMFPDLYPSLEFELEVIASAKHYLRELKKLHYNKQIDVQARYASNTFRPENLLNHLPYNEDMPAEVIKERERIVQMYENAGFTYRYFMYYNENSPAAQASLGRIPITPNIFEAGATAFPLHRYAHDWDFVANDVTIRNADYPWVDDQTGTRAPPFSSWNRQNLIRAIEKSGLVVRFGERSGDGKGQKSIGVRRSHVNLPPRKVKSRYASVVGINLENYNMSRDRYNRLGFPTNLYAYIALYRKLFKTLSYIDWEKAVRMNIVPLQKIASMATEFGLNPRLPPLEIVQRIQEISAKRMDMARHIAELVPAQATAVIFQPNSAWLKPVTRYQFADANMILERPYEQFVLVKTLCQNATVSKQEFLRKLEIAGMANMVPPGMDVDPNYSKSDVCDYLSEHIGYKASKFENLFFDCADPDIDMQSIFNTLENMELDGIIKDLDRSTLTKDRLCEVVNNYLRLLLEAKARTIAEL